MHEFLLFTYYAPIAAFGQIAVGEERDSWERPSKSGVLGLLAAGLGLDRSDRCAQIALAKAYGYAVRTDASGRPLSDYHTIQTATRRSGNKCRAATRREAITSGNLATIVSRRTYYCDSLFTVCLWAVEPQPKWSLSKLVHALSFPRYLPYAGRKACPFGLPFAPDIVKAATLMQAMVQRPAWPVGLQVDYHDKGDMVRQRLIPHHTAWGREIAYDADADANVVQGIEKIQTHFRRDSVVDRIRWQFSDRRETVGLLPPPKSAEQ